MIFTGNHNRRRAAQNGQNNSQRRRSSNSEVKFPKVFFIQITRHKTFSSVSGTKQKLITTLEGKLPRITKQKFLFADSLGIIILIIELLLVGGDEQQLQQYIHDNSRTGREQAGPAAEDQGSRHHQATRRHQTHPETNVRCLFPLLILDRREG